MGISLTRWMLEGNEQANIGNLKQSHIRRVRDWAFVMDVSWIFFPSADVIVWNSQAGVLSAKERAIDFPPWKGVGNGLGLNGNWSMRGWGIVYRISWDTLNGEWAWVLWTAWLLLLWFLRIVAFLDETAEIYWWNPQAQVTRKNESIYYCLVLAVGNVIWCNCSLVTEKGCNVFKNHLPPPPLASPSNDLKVTRQGCHNGVIWASYVK